MKLSRRTLLATSTATALPLRRLRAQTKPVIRIGVMNDMSGPYRDVNGPTGVVCTKQAVQEFAAGAFDVEVLSRIIRTNPTWRSRWAASGSTARRGHHHRRCRDLVRAGAWIVCKEKNKVLIPTSTASSDVTGKACTPNSIHWVFDTYMEAKSTGGAMVKAGGDTWYFITPNYAFGRRRSATRPSSSRQPVARCSARSSIRSPRPPISPPSW